MYLVYKALKAMDFVVEHGPKQTHILNGVNPALTCSLPFGSYVVKTILNSNEEDICH